MTTNDNDFGLPTGRLDQMVTNAVRGQQVAPYRAQRALPLVLLIALIAGYLTVLPQSQTMAALDSPLDDINDIVAVEILEQA